MYITLIMYIPYPKPFPPDPRHAYVPKIFKRFYNTLRLWVIRVLKLVYGGVSFFRHTFVIPSSYLRLTIAKTSVNLQRNEFVVKGCVPSGYHLVKRRSFFAVFFFVIPSSYLRLTVAKTSVNMQRNGLAVKGCVPS